MALEKPLIHAPEFPPLEWINAPSEISLKGLRGQVILIEIWDFTCINCLRTLPYLRGWHERYSDSGLQMIGVHTPEFSFARARPQVEGAVNRLGIRWPVLLDNDQAIWTAYSNRYWPTLYLVDANGYIRYRHVGERGYTRTERAIQALLHEVNPDLILPDPLGTVRPEDADGAVCHPSTPELHTESVGNHPPPLDVPLLMDAPPQRQAGRFYLQGTWLAVRDGLSLAGNRGEIYLPYEAASINAVFSPSPDPVTLALDLDTPIEVSLMDAGDDLRRDSYGEDVFLKEGSARVRVDAPRLYSLVRHPDFRQGELHLKVQGKGLTLYAFSFGTCLAPTSDAIPVQLE